MCCECDQESVFRCCSVELVSDKGSVRRLDNVLFQKYNFPKDIYTAIYVGLTKILVDGKELFRIIKQGVMNLV